MVNAKSEEIKNFKNGLIRYLNTVEEETNCLIGSFDQLGESWKDEQHDRFEEIFEELIRSLQLFRENTEEQIPHLEALIRKLEEIERMNF